MTIAGTAPLILIVWEHGGNLGHLGRLLPIARTLRQQGYTVVFAEIGRASCRERVSLVV